MRTHCCQVFCALIALLAVAAAAPALATGPKVATVPWNPGGGIYTNQHTTYDGYNMLLMAVAQDDDLDAPIVSYEWDFGDATGSGVIGVGATSELNIEIRHVYNGVDNTPYTASLTVCDSNADCTTDDFRIVVKTLALDIEVNIAIDEGLWYLHKAIAKFPDGATGEPLGRWTNSGYFASATSSTVQSFLINEHLTTNDPAEDPYTDTVIRGVNYMLTLLSRVNTVATKACVATGPYDPDSNGNAYSLGVASTRPLYETGQVMDALAATRQPGALAVTGIPEVLGQTYEQIAEDMGDYYSHCQDDVGGDQGGWRYSCDNDSDNSAAQWGAIGNLGIEQVFSVATPACVETQNLLWLNASRWTTGSLAGCYGYSGVNCIHGCMATTPSGMVQLAMDGVLNTDPLWTDAEDCMCRNWAGWAFPNGGNMYAKYALAKAMRGAIGGTDDMIGEANPASCPGGTAIDWYTELATNLVNQQLSNGTWTGSFWVGNGPLATAWAIIILKPTLFCPAPIADCNADPDFTTTDCPISFDGTQSFHPGAGSGLEGCGMEIVSYEWDFDDGDTATGDSASHSYAAFGTYNATLTVTDDIGVSTTTTCPVTVGPPPIDPDSDPNGPYELCLNLPGGSVVLDGEGSLDPDNSPCQAGSGIALCEWEIDFAEFPPDFNDAIGCTSDQTAFYNALGVGTYDVGLRVTDDEGATDDDFTTVTVRDDCPPPPCPPDPDPRSQGYWHRQCLGLPAPVGIDPGRNGRGPQSPTEPGFEDQLLPAIDMLLEDLGFFGETTCTGMDADPSNSQCEKALKQFTAMLLNVASGRIAEGCLVDVNASPCSSNDVGGLIQEIAALIQGGDCSTAKECAEPVNLGESLFDTSAAPGEGVVAQAAVQQSGDEGAAELQQNSSQARARTKQDTGNAVQQPRGPRETAAPGGINRGGRILYYLVPSDYTADDPRVRIVSTGGPQAVADGVTRAEAFGPGAQAEPETEEGASQRPVRGRTAPRGGDLP